MKLIKLTMQTCAIEVTFYNDKQKVKDILIIIF